MSPVNSGRSRKRVGPMLSRGKLEKRRGISHPSSNEGKGEKAQQERGRQIVRGAPRNRAPKKATQQKGTKNA